MKSNLPAAYLYILSVLPLMGCSESQTDNHAQQNANRQLEQSARLTKDHLTRWDPRDLPLELQISADFDAEESAAIMAMASEWESALDINAPLFLPQKNAPALDHNRQLIAYKDQEIGVYQNSRWFPNISSDALAITQFFGKRVSANTAGGDAILLQHADIILNTKKYRFVLNEDDILGSGDQVNAIDGRPVYHLASVVLHEMGHLLGMPHLPQGSDSVMVPTLKSGAVKEQIQRLDFRNIQKVYADHRQVFEERSLASSKDFQGDDTVYGVIETFPAGMAQREHRALHD